MKITLMQRYHFNETKPIMEIRGVDGTVQWDECDLSECPPARGPSTMTAHGKINIVSHDDLPKTFTDTDGNEHEVDNITSYRSSK